MMATTTQRPLSLAARTVLDVIKKDVKRLVESGACGLGVAERIRQDARLQGASLLGNLE